MPIKKILGLPGAVAGAGFEIGREIGKTRATGKRKALKARQRARKAIIKRSFDENKARRKKK